MTDVTLPPVGNPDPIPRPEGDPGNVPTDYTQYNPTDYGRITGTGTAGTQDNVTNPDAPFGYIWGVKWDSSLYYVDNQTQMSRQPLSASWDTQVVTPGQTATISGLPSPCRLLVDGLEVIVNDGVFELEPQTPGVYSVVADQTQYLIQSWEITCNEAQAVQATGRSRKSRGKNQWVLGPDGS